MKRILAMAALVGLLATEAHSQHSALATCPLDPGLREVNEACKEGSPALKPTTCSALRALEHLARDEAEAAGSILTSELAVPASSVEKMMSWLNFLGMSVIDLDDSPAKCTQAQGLRLIGLAASGFLEDIQHPETLLLLGRVVQWSEVLMGKLEERLSPEARPALRVFTRAVSELVARAQLGDLIQQGLTSNPMVEMIAGRFIPSDPTVKELATQEARLQVDLAIELAQAGSLPEARGAVSRAVTLAESDQEKALLLLRAGVRLAAIGHLEEGLYFLQQVENATSSSPSTEEIRAIRSVAKWFVALSHDELNLERPVGSEEVRLLEGELGDIIDAFGRGILARDESTSAAISDIARILASEEVSAEELEPLMSVIEQVLPGLDTGAGTARYATSNWNIRTAASQGLKSYPDFMLKITELMVLGRYEDAAAEAKEFITHYPKYNNIYMLTLVAVKQWLAGDRAAAIANNREAVVALEKLVEAFRVDELQTAFVDDKVVLAFRLALEMSAQEGRVDEAFDYAERLRSWTLRRLLGGTRTIGDPVEGSRGAEDHKLLPEIRELEGIVLQSGQAHEARRKLSRKRAEFATRRLEKKLDAAGSSALAQVETITLEELQKSEVLDPETTLLAYAAGLDGLWAWVIDRESKEMFYLPISEEELDRLACLAAEQRRPGTRGVSSLSLCQGLPGPTSTALYTQLIEPLADYIRKKNLIIVPTGLLNHISFAALQNPRTQRYLIQDFALSLAPSATALTQLLASARVERQGNTLILGDPTTEWRRLAGAEHEAKEVAKLFGIEPRIGEQATEHAVHEHAGNLNILHLAAHGEYTAENPIFSGILLGADTVHDGRLEMHEVWDELNLNGTRLVTLSGCQTAIGETTRGDEVVGLTQAFLVAGSRAVLSTLWKVHDKASAALMVAFYRQLRGGKSVSEALQAAQLELLNDQVYFEPYYWAGYTLTGDPRTRWLD